MKTTKLFAVLSVALAVSAARATDASYLYWMVQNASYGGSAVNFDYATIKGNGTLLNIYDVGSATPAESQEVGSYSFFDAEAPDGTYAGSSTYGAPYTGVYAGFDDSINTFLIELWLNETGERVGYQSYSIGAVGDNITSGTSVATGALIVSDVVPEPTSGLLSLFGLAALALRRRRRA